MVEDRGRWGRLDVLVNNAGEQTPAESILDLTQEQLVRVPDQHLQHVLPGESRTPHLPEGGAIVNTTSVTAYQGSPNLLDYRPRRGHHRVHPLALRERRPREPPHPRERRGARAYLDAAEPRLVRARHDKVALRRVDAHGAPRPALRLAPAYVFWPATIPATSPAR
ncbi:MAG: SDR family oxidoreductase [Eggerthella lenta]